MSFVEQDDVLQTIEPVFALLGATTELMPMISEYMRIWYWVAPMDLALWTSLASIRATRSPFRPTS